MCQFIEYLTATHYAKTRFSPLIVRACLVVLQGRKVSWHTEAHREVSLFWKHWSRCLTIVEISMALFFNFARSAGANLTDQLSSFCGREVMVTLWINAVKHGEDCWHAEPSAVHELLIECRPQGTKTLWLVSLAAPLPKLGPEQAAT